MAFKTKEPLFLVIKIKGKAISDICGIGLRAMALSKPNFVARRTIYAGVSLLIGIKLSCNSIL